MKKWEVILDNGYRSIVQMEDNDSPRMEYDRDARKAFVKFGYDSKNGFVDAERVVICRPLLDELTEQVMNALKKEQKTYIPT